VELCRNRRKICPIMWEMPAATMKKSVTRYEELADQLSSQIRAGLFLPGERLPSVRSSGRVHELSSNTVLQAYHLLEDRGEIRARIRSGYYVAPQAPSSPEKAIEPAGADKARPGSIAELAFDLYRNAKAPGHVQFGAGWPSAELFPLAKLTRALKTSVQGLNLNAWPVYIQDANSELSRYIARRSLQWGFDGTADDVVVTSGALEGLLLCLRAVAKPGDTVAVETSSSYMQRCATEQFGLRTVEIPTDPQHGVSLPALAAALKKGRIRACLFTPNFHHPLGASMPEAKKRELVALLARHEVPLVENDVLGELHHAQDRPKPAKAYDRKGLVLYCSSFSKSLAPGFSVGWALPGRFTKFVRRAKWTTNTSSGITTQTAVAEYLKQGGYEHHLRRLRRSLASLQVQAVQALRRHMPSGTVIVPPAGGYLLWVQLPRPLNAAALYRLALQKKITIAPGAIFGSSPHHQNCFRLNYSQSWTPRIEAAIGTLGQIASSMRR